MHDFLKRLFFRLAAFFRQLGKKFNQRSPEQEAILKKWKAAKGDLKLRYDYDLNESSVVFDLGGFNGDWSAEIYARFRAKVEIFEPHPDFAKAITQRFLKNTDIRVHEFGLSGKDTQIKLTTAGAASSSFKSDSSNEMVVGNLKAAGKYLITHDFKNIDLIKINIEG